MSEKYTRLFALEENLYSEGSPVVISAGALLKDNRTGSVLAQFKIKNISRKTIRAAVVRLTTFDSFGKTLDDTVEKEYLDLAVERDGEFGQKVLIPLPNAAARAFTAVVTCVGFADNTVWNYAGAEQAALPHRKLLTETLEDPQLVKQYQIKYGVRAKMFPEAYKDIWFCTCGALCHADEGSCHSCGNKKAELLSFDREALTAEKEERLEKEAEEYRKAAEEAEAARKKAEEEAAVKAKRTKKIAAITIPVVCVCIAFVVLLTQVILPKQKLNKAMDMIDAGEYDSAYTILEELGNTEAIAESKYDRAMSAIDAGDYDFAYALLEELGKREEIAANKHDRAMESIAAQDYETAYVLLEEIGTDEEIAACKYDWAMERINAQDYEAAFTLLDGLNYKDSEEKQESIWPQYRKVLLRKADVGDTVSFGVYEQDNNQSNGKEEIEWLVLAKEDNRILVISDKGLDCQRYNTLYTEVTWENCTLRKWLNEDFLSAAFSDEEKAMIPTVTVSADKNPKLSPRNDTDPGRATQDQIFLLSITEAEKYFSSDEARKCTPTAYAKAKGVYTSDEYKPARGKEACFWWLRTPGFNQLVAANVYNDGSPYSFVNIDGTDYAICYTVDDDCLCVRPAMWIDLST